MIRGASKRNLSRFASLRFASLHHRKQRDRIRPSESKTHSTSGFWPAPDYAMQNRDLARARICTKGTQVGMGAGR
jgi:hypothetical protein